MICYSGTNRTTTGKAVFFHSKILQWYSHTPDSHKCIMHWVLTLWFLDAPATPSTCAKALWIFNKLAQTSHIKPGAFMALRAISTLLFRIKECCISRTSKLHRTDSKMQCVYSVKHTGLCEIVNSIFRFCSTVHHVFLSPHFLPLSSLRMCLSLPFFLCSHEPGYKTWDRNTVIYNSHRSLTLEEIHRLSLLASWNQHGD